MWWQRWNGYKRIQLINKEKKKSREVGMSRWKGNPVWIVQEIQIFTRAPSGILFVIASCISLCLGFFV